MATPGLRRCLVELILVDRVPVMTKMPRVEHDLDLVGETSCAADRMGRAPSCLL